MSCNHSPGRRFYGGGFVNGVPEDRIAAPTYPLRGVRSADECQGLCRDQPQCRTFVFSRRAGTCALHRTGFAGAAPDESFSSGSCKANKEGAWAHCTCVVGSAQICSDSSAGLEFGCWAGAQRLCAREDLAVRWSGPAVCW